MKIDCIWRTGKAIPLTTYGAKRAGWKSAAYSIQGKFAALVYDYMELMEIDCIQHTEKFAA
jgi:hypothetical protein